MNLDTAKWDETDFPNKLVAKELRDKLAQCGMSISDLGSTYLADRYRKDTEPLYHSFMYSLVSLLSSIYPLPVMHSLLVTLSFGITRL